MVLRPLIDLSGSYLLSTIEDAEKSTIRGRNSLTSWTPSLNAVDDLRARRLSARTKMARLTYGYNHVTTLVLPCERIMQSSSVQRSE